MNVYKIEIDTGKMSNEHFTILGKDFKEATAKAFQMLQEIKANYESAEIYEISYDSSVSEIQENNNSKEGKP